MNNILIHLKRWYLHGGQCRHHNVASYTDQGVERNHKAARKQTATVCQAIRGYKLNLLTKSPTVIDFTCKGRVRTKNKIVGVENTLSNFKFFLLMKNDE